MTFMFAVPKFLFAVRSFDVCGPLHLLTLNESRIGKSEEGSKTIGRLILSYECEYTKDLMPDVPENLPPFKVVSTDWRN